VGVLIRLVLLFAGCSLIYDGSDLRGKGANRPAWTHTKTFVAGNGAAAVAVGDIDGNGQLDIAVPNGDDSTLTMLMNQGGGSFTPATAARTCQTPVGIAMADFNESGQSDAVVICYDDFNSTPPATAARIFLGSPSGFNVSMPVPLDAEQPVAVSAGDIDGDGHADLVIAYRSPNGVALQIGQGDGTFKPGTLVHTPDVPADMVVADLNGDGAPDVAIAGDTSLQVLLTQKGQLGTVSSYPIHNGGFGITAGDFDGQNGRDLAIPTYTNFFLDVELNQGGGTFPANLPAEVSFPDYPSHLRAADFDGDGHLDIALGSLTEGVVMLFYGKGDGTFEAPLQLTTSSTSGMEVADLDGDKRPDIILSSIDQTGLITILFNR
jgi:hypothetical protein